MNKVLDYGERLFLVLLTSFYLKSMLLVAFTNPALLLVALSETLAVVLILIRRPGAISTSPVAFAAALIGTACPLLARPAVVAPLLPTAWLALMMLLGLVVSVSAKLALWRSFGLTAANRGVRRGGPYRLVRHPMYLGYFLTELGFLLGDLTVRNLAVLLVAWSAQLVRIREEELFLMQDEQYRDLASRVRFRLLPGLY